MSTAALHTRPHPLSNKATTHYVWANVAGEEELRRRVEAPLDRAVRSLPPATPRPDAAVMRRGTICQLGQVTRSGSVVSTSLEGQIQAAVPRLHGLSLLRTLVSAVHVNERRLGFSNTTRNLDLNVSRRYTKP